MRCILGAGARPANREIPRARALPPEPSRPPTSTRGREVRAAGLRARAVGAPSGLARLLARSLAAGPGGASSSAVSSVDASLLGRAASALRERVLRARLPPCGPTSGGAGGQVRQRGSEPSFPTRA